MEESRKTTTNHSEIQQWAEKHEGKPQKIDHPDASADTIGLRIDFPGSKDEEYGVTREATDISWEEFFLIFDQQKLSFEYYPEDLPNKTASDLYRFLKL